ncbi:hypothetical protein FCV25MIE_14235 [Fagus crenata]
MHILVSFWQIEGGFSLNASDKAENAISNEVSEDGKDVPNPALSPPGNAVQVNMADWKVGENVDVVRDAPLEEMEVSREANMKAYITADDVIRAGGFGARDDISCFLPVASDSTDFEATIRDARDYEEPQGEISRPGLGWTEAKEAD